jgi:hypothetical protein
MEFNTAPHQDANCLADSRSARPARTRNAHKGGNARNARGWCLVRNDERLGVEGPELPQQDWANLTHQAMSSWGPLPQSLLAQGQYFEGGVGEPAEEDTSGGNAKRKKMTNQPQSHTATGPKPAPGAGTVRVNH